jgi:hypothetical protein
MGHTGLEPDYGAVDFCVAGYPIWYVSLGNPASISDRLLLFLSLLFDNHS